MVVPICLSKLFKNTTTGKTNNHILNVVSSPLTLNPDYEAGLIGTQRTLFKEIVSVPYAESLPPLYLKRLMQIQPQVKPVSESEFITSFITSLTSYIKKVWDPNKFNVILHSGGWDSRILSAILRRIYMKREANFGKILFACSVSYTHLTLPTILLV